MTNKSIVPIGVWIKTLAMLLLLIGATTLYDRYYKQNNSYIQAVQDRLNTSTHESDKPLVVAIGASLEMLATPRDWQTDEFYWLRVIIQGSQLDDFAPVTDDVLRLKPDLVVIGLHQFIEKPYARRLREAFKRLLRAPLESTGLIHSRINQHEVTRCSGSSASTQEVITHIQDQFQSPHNTLLSSRVLQTILANDIPVLILRTPMLEDIETNATNRNVWLETAYQNLEALGLDMLETSRMLDQAYFCPDQQHANPMGEIEISKWLKTQLVNTLEALQ